MTEPNLYEKFLIDNRVACPEAGYPISEARYVSTNEFKMTTGRDLLEEFLNKQEIVQ